MKHAVLDKSLKFLGELLPAMYRNQSVPGWVVAISHKGKLVFHEAYGWANVERQEKMRTDHIFRIASQSKTLTATAIMQLQEKSKLRIDEPIAKYLTWLKEHSDKRWQKVTIRQLMSHGAGIMRDGPHHDYWTLAYPFPDGETLKKEIFDAKLVIDNNTKMKYSNHGYGLLGLLIEQVSGMSYGDFVQQSIIQPLGLKNTSPDYNPKMSERMVTGYTRHDTGTRKPIDDVNTQALASATGFCATAEDLCTYFTAHMVGSGQLLSDESKKEMQKKQWDVLGSKDERGYGLGLEANRVHEWEVKGHSGGFPGQVTKSILVPSEELVVVVLTNAIDGWAGYMVTSVLKILSSFQGQIAEKPDKKLEKFEGTFMNLWGLMHIVTGQDKFIALYPESWEPFEDAGELTYVDDTTLRETKTGSFGHEGELVRYEFNPDNTVKQVDYAGAIFLPAESYLESIKDKPIIKLPE